MRTVRLDGTAIHDEASWHAECRRAFGFPEFYGANWDAWLDCMSYVDEPSAGMSSVHVAVGECLEIELTNTDSLSKKCPEILHTFVECTAAANARFVDRGARTRITLTFLEKDPV